MTEADWRRYMAEFVEQIREAFPTTEIVHNALWFMPLSDEYVQRQLLAADVICIEPGFNDAGIVNAEREYGFGTLVDVIDWLHAQRRAVWIDSTVTSATAREYGLAAYLLTTIGIDYIGNTPGAEWDNWWSGYDIDRGKPLARSQYGHVFQREFEDGLVIVNQPRSGKAILHLGETFLSMNGASHERDARVR